jgi:hypothetical protein
MLKNTVFKSASYALGIPVGSSTITPDSPTVGQTLWNSSTNKLEYYNGTIWEAIAHEGNVTLVRDSFTGNNVQTDFNMSISYSAGEQNKVLVFVGTVVQQPTTNYVFTGGTEIQFLAAPSMGSDISVIHNLGSTIAA